jgi:broad specificity phosphatase PhoE
MQSPSGVTELLFVRHGESTANVAADRAERQGLEVIDVGSRDADVQLSPTGVEQATALGAWLAAHGADAVWSSPYRRAVDTATIAMEVAQRPDALLVDERLRDRELGILDTLTSLGVERRYPDEAARRRWVGKYFYRPPGGESWADVALRLRSALGDLDSRHPGQSVLVVAHDAVVVLALHLLLGWSEEEVLDFTLSHTVPNVSVTSLSRTEEGWSLTEFASTEHLVTHDAPVTEHPGDKDADVH